MKTGNAQKRWLSIVIGMLSCICCFSQDIPSFPNGREGLMALGEFIAQASEEERLALTEACRPPDTLYNAVFEKQFGKRVRSYHRRYWRLYKPVMAPVYPTQTEPLVFMTTPDSLTTYTGEARQFPGGYREIADLFQKDLVLYRLKLVQPGMQRGTAFDVWIYMDGHWRIFPRPWVVMDALLDE